MADILVHQPSLTFKQPNIVCFVMIYLKMHKLLYLGRAQDRLIAESGRGFDRRVRTIMRALLLALPLSVLTLLPSSGNAGQAGPRQIAAVSVNARTNRNQETYRGYLVDLSQIAGQQNFAVMADALRHQLDIVETVGLSQRVLEKFHTVPIVVDELQCLRSEDPPRCSHPPATLMLHPTVRDVRLVKYLRFGMVRSISGLTRTL